MRSFHVTAVRITYVVAMCATLVSEGATLDDLRARAATLVSQMTVAEKISQLRHEAPAIERLWVPEYNWWNEALHGVARNGRATVFPEPIGMAASFDPELVEEVAAAISDEARAKYAASVAAGNRGIYAGLTFWSPNVNIYRDPRWGRGIETWGEDPYLSGTMGVAFIRGMQGEDPVYLKTAACAKHYAVHSGPEALRHTFNACPSKKDLRETYLPAFEMCVKEGKVEAVMSAYNRVYGESASASKYLLKDILRGEWGFKGHIVSDCGAVCDIWSGHKIVKTPPEAAARAVRAGLTFECGPCFKYLGEALERGLVTEEEIDDALVTLFTTRFRLGIMGADPECPYNTPPDASCICGERHRDIARRIARESMVLLKNNGVLPLDAKRGKYNVVGAGATDIYALMGNYYGISSSYVTYLEGIVSHLDPGVRCNYNPGYCYGGGASSGRIEGDGDTVILVLGNTNAYEGEENETIASEANGDRVSLALPKEQVKCFRLLRRYRAKGKRLITVITGGGPVELKEIAEGSDAVVLAWYGGEEGGNALADLLFGMSDFTGRLPVTFPETAADLPPFDDYSMSGRTYRYQTRGVMFPFGHGLSYAAFAAGSPSALSDGKGGLRVTVPVSNVSARDGVSVVQLYVSTPGAGKGAPLKSLVAFSRVALKSGEKKIVSFVVDGERLVEYDENGVPHPVPEDALRFSVAL